MSRYTKYAVLLVSIFVLFLVWPALTSACGGFFCANTPIDQGAERIIFTVNKDEGTITAIVGINYVGAAADFSWVVPVPSPPVLDVAETTSLNTLERATAVQVNNPPSYCNGIFPGPCCFGGGGDGLYLSEGGVGPYDYAIIGSNDPDELMTWLRDNGYQVTREMEPLIRVYVEEEMYFLAMKLNQDSDVDDIQPVVMTYESDQPMIPIRLTAVAAIPNMPILTWIFADTQYMPENYAHATPDFSAFRAPGELATDSFGNYFFRNGNGLYSAERTRIQDQYNGLAFITEYAGPSDSLPPQAHDDPLIGRLIEDYPYVTRVRAQMSPEQMTLDPEFVPAPYEPDVSNVVDLADYVDPLEYWGCSSRTVLSEETIANLPPGRTRVDDLQFEVAHPDNWVLSEFDVGEQHFRAFAPEAVDEDTIAAFFAGDDTLPMLVFTEVNTFIDTMDGNSATEELLAQLGQPNDTAIPSDSEGRDATRVRYWPTGGYGAYDGLRAVLFGMLADDADWRENEAMYDAMLAYADSYQYFVDADFQHTLFLKSQEIYYVDILVPYGDGWAEQVGEDEDIFIAPEGSTNLDAAPVLRLTSASRFQLEDANMEERWAVARDWIVSEFGVSEDKIISWQTMFLRCDSTTHTPPIPFEHDGGRGYVRFMNDEIVSVYAPADEFAQHEDALLQMLEGIEFVDCL